MENDKRNQSVLLAQIHVIEPEGTYLVWLDCRAFGMNKNGLEKFMKQKARIFFGEEGDGFERINIACPKTVLIKALNQLKPAVDTL
jgi:cysteine-S-conjugate beta-lyase